MKTAAQSAGGAAEQRALAQLRAAGQRLIARNFHCRAGELDLVMADGRTLVIVEVRYRRAGNRHADAAATIGHHKRRRLVAAARAFLACHPRFESWPVRFDVVAIDGDELRWIPQAFDAEE